MSGEIDSRDVHGFYSRHLPAHEGAFAMTVRKARNSTRSGCCSPSNRVLPRELVYSGITVARRGLHVARSAELVQDAPVRQASRWPDLG